MTLEELLPFIIPLVILQLALMVFGLYDLTRPDRRVKGDSKLLWAIVIVVVNLFGPLVYFMFGREES